MDAGDFAVRALLLALTLAVPGAAQAQQYSIESTVRLIQDANEECYRAFPNAIKQAIKTANCENRNAEALRSMLPYPDLMDQELAYNLVLAEKVQKGKMTLIERDAAATQFHSQMSAEQERRQLAAGVARAQESTATAASRAYSGGPASEPLNPTPQASTPQLQNILPQITRCQSMPVGSGMVQTVCR